MGFVLSAIEVLERYALPDVPTLAEQIDKK
jgi:hypothetical protein